MVPTTSVDAILDGMVGALSVLTPAVGTAVTPTKYIRSVGRFLGLPQQGNTAARSQISAVLADGVAGRTPAVQVAFDREERINTTVGRRVDKIRGFFSAYCITDIREPRDRRAMILAMCADVRGAIGARMFGLPIRPMLWQRDELLLDTDQALMYAVRFATVYRIDFTIDPGPDVMETATGDIHASDGSVTYGDIAITPPQETP